MRKINLIIVVAMLASLNMFAESAEEKKTRAATIELMNVMQFPKMLDNMAESLGGQMPIMLKQMLEAQPDFAKLPARKKEKAIEVALKALEKSDATIGKIFRDPEVVKGIEDLMVNSYTKHFTSDEVKAITAFYKSPAGQKTLAVMPLIMADSMPQITKLIIPRAKKLGETIAKDALAMAQSLK